MDTIKLLEENKGRMLFDINHSNIFLDPRPSLIKIKPKISKWDTIKPESFCIAKQTINEIFKKYGMRENICNRCNFHIPCTFAVCVCVWLR